MSRDGRWAGRERRDDLVGEHPWGDAGQIIFAILFLVIWIGDTLLGFTTFLNGVVPLAVRIPMAAVLLVVAGLLAHVSLRIVFGETRETPHVIRKSVFNIVRHPMYLSEVLLYVGLLLASLSLAASAVLVITTAFLHYISRHEERQLVARFGDAYRQYMHDVPMWIPRARKPRRPSGTAT